MSQNMFFNSRVESWMLGQNGSGHKCNRTVTGVTFLLGFSVWISLMMTNSGWNMVQ